MIFKYGHRTVYDRRACSRHLDFVTRLVVDRLQATCPSRLAAVFHVGIPRLDDQAVLAQALFQQGQAVDIRQIDVGRPPRPALRQGDGLSNLAIIT